MAGEGGHRCCCFRRHPNRRCGCIPVMVSHRGLLPPKSCWSACRPVLRCICCCAALLCTALAPPLNLNLVHLNLPTLPSSACPQGRNGAALLRSAHGPRLLSQGQAAAAANVAKWAAKQPRVMGMLKTRLRQHARQVGVSTAQYSPACVRIDAPCQGVWRGLRLARSYGQKAAAAAAACPAALQRC